MAGRPSSAVSRLVTSSYKLPQKILRQTLLFQPFKNYEQKTPQLKVTYYVLYNHTTVSRDRPLLKSKD